MRRLRVLLLAAGLLAPAPAFAGNDYPGGAGLGAAPQAADGVPQVIIAPPLLTEAQIVPPSETAMMGPPPRSQLRTESGSIHNAIVPLVTANLIPPGEVQWTDVARSGGNYTQLFPSASQPTSNGLPAAYVTLAPGQLYPSGSQPTTSTAGRPAGAVGAATSSQGANLTSTTVTVAPTSVPSR